MPASKTCREIIKSMEAGVLQKEIAGKLEGKWENKGNWRDSAI